MNLLAPAGAILLFLLSAQGWGRLVTSRIYPESRPGTASMAVCGLCLWIFIGGVLNVARFAYPAVLDAILGLGLVFSGTFAISDFKANRIASAGESSLSRALFCATVAAIFLFLVATLTPAAAFNLFDDFHVYLPRPMRMLHTGSLGGNPFDVLGIDSLGAQAFLQSFFVHRLSISHINAFDAIACFVLGLLLLVEVKHRLGIHWTFLLASAITFVAIDPQYVNVSSLYSGSLMILGLVFVSIAVVDEIGGADRERAFAGAAALALAAVSLVALKSTFAVFAGLYLAVFLGYALFLSEDRRRTARSIFVTTLTIAVLISPWILLSLPNYLAALRIGIAGKVPVAAGYGADIDFVTKLFFVFSPAKSNWGGSYLAYSALAVLLALAGFALSIRIAKSRSIAGRGGMAAILAACIAAAISYFVNLYLFDPQNGLRYSIPILIAATSATLLLAGSLARTSGTNGIDRSVARVGGAALLATAVASGGAFHDELFSRIQRAYDHRTLLPFDAVTSKEYRSHMAASLGEGAASHVLDLQNRVGKDHAILAWTQTPFHFDFARNKVFNATDSTVLNPWLADFLLDADPERIRRYLLERGVRYVMFEHAGYGVIPDGEFESYLGSPFRMVRQTGERNLLLRRVLRHLARNSRVLFANAEIVMFDIGRRPGSSD